MELNQEILSQEHMLSEAEVKDLQSNGSLPLVEEMHGIYGLQVIRKTYQNIGSWGNDIQISDTGSDRYSPTYVMGKNNIPLCVVGVTEEYKKPLYTFKSAKSFKERGDTHHTQSIKISSLMRNISKRDAVESLEKMLPKLDNVQRTLNSLTNEEIDKIDSRYRDKSIKGYEYHELLEYALNPDKKIANDNDMSKTLKEFDDMKEDITNRKSDKASMFSKPIYVIGYNQLSESYCEYVYDRDTSDENIHSLKIKLSDLHKPLGVGEDYPVSINKLPNYDKYASILPMWSARLPEMKDMESNKILANYFYNSNYSSDTLYDSKLSVMAWGYEQGYGWGKHDFYLAIFNIEDV